MEPIHKNRRWLVDFIEYHIKLQDYALPNYRKVRSEYQMALDYSNTTTTLITENE